MEIVHIFSGGEKKEKKKEEEEKRNPLESVFPRCIV
jgi:hypothetical protein